MNRMADKVPPSLGLENEALRILGVKHPLDNPELNVTLFFNRLFPNGKRRACYTILPQCTKLF